jgi:hypothetical protein
MKNNEKYQMNLGVRCEVAAIVCRTSRLTGSSFVMAELPRYGLLTASKPI